MFSTNESEAGIFGRIFGTQKKTLGKNDLDDQVENVKTYRTSQRKNSFESNQCNTGNTVGGISYMANQSLDVVTGTQIENFYRTFCYLDISTSIIGPVGLVRNP